MRGWPSEHCGGGRWSAGARWHACVPTAASGHAERHWKRTGKPTAAWMSWKVPRSSGGGRRPCLSPARALSMARMLTPSSERGYATCGPTRGGRTTACIRACVAPKPGECKAARTASCGSHSVPPHCTRPFDPYALPQACARRAGSPPACSAEHPSAPRARRLRGACTHQLEAHVLQLLGAQDGRLAAALEHVGHLRAAPHQHTAGCGRTQLGRCLADPRGCHRGGGPTKNLLPCSDPRRRCCCCIATAAVAQAGLAHLWQAAGGAGAPAEAAHLFLALERVDEEDVGACREGSARRVAAACRRWPTRFTRAVSSG